MNSKVAIGGLVAAAVGIGMYALGLYLPNNHLAIFGAEIGGAGLVVILVAFLR